MPEGHAKRCGQILWHTGKIQDLLYIFDHAAAKTGELDESESKQVLDYLSCVHVSMVQFLKRTGLEAGNGTP